MRLFLDTDVILDVALERHPHFISSSAVLDWAESNMGSVAVSWHGMANINYLFKKSEPFIKELLTFVEIPPTGTEHLEYALSLNFTDLEDAMQVSSAALFGAQIIVTRNLKHYKKSPISAKSPEEVISILPKRR